jgi:very-short-patch-repair endonuclease
MAGQKRGLDAPPLIRGATVSAEKRALARKFRREPTSSEQLAWELLRNRKCLGLKFRRQQVIRGYIVDFYCAELRLALEIDGPIHQHAGRAEADVLRMLRVFIEANVRFVRLPAHRVTEQNLCALLTPLLPLSREGEGVGG